MRLHIPTTLLVFLLFLLAKAAHTPTSGVTDPDFFWHLASGEWMLGHGHIPATDTFSWSFSDQPYQMTEWLGEVIIALAYRIAGFDGTLLLGVAITGVTLAFSWAAASRYTHTGVALMLAILTNASQLTTPMRPQLFTFALTSILVWCLVMWKETHKPVYLWLVVPIMSLWTNLHGGFVVGLAIIALMISVQAWEDFCETRAWRQLVEPLSALASAICATGANPYGFKALSAVIAIANLQSASVIPEWQPVTFTTGIGACYLLLAAPFIWLVCAGVRPPRSWAPIATFALVFGYTATKQVPIAGAIMAPVLAATIAGWPRYAALRLEIRTPSDGLIYGTIVSVMASALFAWHNVRPDIYQRYIDRTNPVHATDFLQKNHLTDRVFNDTWEGSYLIYRGIRTSIDNRMDLYGDTFFFPHYLAQKGTQGWDAFLDGLAPQSILLRNAVALRQLVLTHPAWRLVYQDMRYSIFVRTGSSPDLPTISPSPITYLDAHGTLLPNYQP